MKPNKSTHALIVGAFILGLMGTVQFTKKTQVTGPAPLAATAKRDLLPGGLSPQASISQTSSVNEQSATIEQSLTSIGRLTKIVFPTPEKLNSLRPILGNPKLTAAIRQSLVDRKTYEGERYHEKLRLLDALYEGLKFPETDISEKYFQTASDVLSDRIPDSYSGDPELRRQFVADRTEIAIAVLKAFPERAKAIEARSSTETPEAKAAFENAHRLMATYEVTL